MAANSRFGLGSMLLTQDINEATRMISEIADGAFFINDMVKSDPRLPFGGTKASGYGRELSKEGILEFVNKKKYISKNRTYESKNRGNELVFFLMLSG